MLPTMLAIFEAEYFLYHFAKVIKNRMVVIQMDELLQCLLHYLELYHQAYYSQLASMEAPNQTLQKGFIEDCLTYLQLKQSCQNSNPPSIKKRQLSVNVLMEFKVNLHQGKHVFLVDAQDFQSLMLQLLENPYELDFVEEAEQVVAFILDQYQDKQAYLNTVVAMAKEIDLSQEVAKFQVVFVMHSRMDLNQVVYSAQKDLKPVDWCFIRDSVLVFVEQS